MASHQSLVTSHSALLVLGFPEFPHIQPDADQRGEKGAHRGSKAHRRQCLGEEEDGEVGAGDADGDDRDHIVQEGVDRFPIGREISREAEVDTGKDAVDDIGTEVFTAKAHDFRLMADEE